MEFWPEFLANSWGREFVAGGFGGIAGVVAGYPLDTLRVRQQSSTGGSAVQILRRLVTAEGPFSLYRGMTAPLASVTFQVLNFLLLFFLYFLHLYDLVGICLDFLDIQHCKKCLILIPSRDSRIVCFCVEHDCNIGTILLPFKNKGGILQ